MKNPNPPDYVRILIFLVIVIPFLGWSIFKYLDNGSVLLLSISLLISLSIIFAVLYSEVIHKPSSIEIMDSGVIFYFRLGKSYSAKWEEIRFLDLDPGQSTIIGKFKRGGQIGLNRPVRERGGPIIPVFQLRYETAKYIYEAYNSHMGRYPDTR
jgi:hypothetical protein